MSALRSLGLSGLLLAGAVGAMPAHAQADPSASSPAPGHRSSADPFEPWNRSVFSFNEKLDEAVLKPVARAYTKLPQPVRTGVANFFGNFGDAWSALNQFLQGKPAAGLQMTMRVATNTVLGIGGLLDVATEAGLDRRSEDFGQTLGVWGFGPGPYLVWPVLGPSTLRDSAGLPLDLSWSPALALHEDAERVGLFGLQLVDTRASLLGASRVLDEIALDKYSFLRDAYLSRRRSLVYDGEPPETPESPEAPETPEAPLKSPAADNPALPAGPARAASSAGPASAPR